MGKNLKIIFRKTGGFAGLSKSVEIDSDHLAAEELGVLQSLVEQAEFFDISTPDQQRHPDEEQYFITVEVDGRSRTIYMNRSAVPDKLKSLIGYLNQRARYERNK